MTDDIIVLDHAPDTGPRLKYFARAADAEYWAERWRRAPEPTYERELAGNLPRPLRPVFRTWVPRGSRVLEAGCGLGRFTVAAHALGYRAEGLDWAADTVERLRARFPGIPWHVGDVRELDFPDGTFDAVYSPGVCEHFEEGPGAILAETRRVLRPGGIAVISAPCFNRLLRRRAARLFPSRRPRGEFYQYAFTPDGMAGLLARQGFEVLRVRPYDVVETFTRFLGWPIPAKAVRPLAVLDSVPVVRQWGRCCVWVARKPLDDPRGRAGGRAGDRAGGRAGGRAAGSEGRR